MESYLPDDSPERNRRKDENMNDDPTFTLRQKLFCYRRPASVPECKRVVRSRPDVDEALNSLLWQPYEYRPVNDRSYEIGLDRDADHRRTTARTHSACAYLESVGCDVSECAMHTDPNRNVPSSIGDGVDGTGLDAANVVGLPMSNHHRHQRAHSHIDAAVRRPQIAHPRSASIDCAPNVTHVDVECYRAVPANVVATAVPTIECSAAAINTISSNTITTTTTNTTTPSIETGNDVSNVRIMPVQGGANNGYGTTRVAVRTRTFTSTEAQTDDVGETREQRRKRRQQRRQQRTGIGGGGGANQALPDILNSHLPPPYTPPIIPTAYVATREDVLPVVVQAPPPPPPPPPPTGFRFPSFPAAGFGRSRFSEEPPKGCCGLLAWKPGSLRWFIAVIALVAICCVLIGTALGAMRPAGRDHLTVSLLMIGVGIVLVSVSAVAWRLTSHDSSTCRSMLGFGSTESVDVCTRRFVPRLPPSYGRPHHPYAAMMYPEFQYRPPPPSYQASMQEYRLRLLLLDRGNTPQLQAGIQNAVSPPPTYRSHAGSLLRAPLSNRRDATQSEYSCPPSYRSQTSTTYTRTAAGQPGGGGGGVNGVGGGGGGVNLHSREHSLTLSDSTHGDAVVNIVNILGATDDDRMTLDSLKLEPETDVRPMMMKTGPDGKDGNLVTIVQTNDQNPVIVTVSGSSQIENGTVRISDMSTEMEILAHL